MRIKWVSNEQKDVFTANPEPGWELIVEQREREPNWWWWRVYSPDGECWRDGYALKGENAKRTCSRQYKELRRRF